MDDHVMNSALGRMRKAPPNIPENAKTLSREDGVFYQGGVRLPFSDRFWHS